MNILVLNVGSATLKFQLIRTDAERIAAATDDRLARGVIERIGGEALLTWFGLTLDEGANQGATGGAELRISREDARLAAWVIPTDDALLIARDTARLVLGLPARY